MLYIPVIGICIVLRKVITTTLTTGEFRIYRIYPFAGGIFWPHKAFIGSEYIPVVSCSLQKQRFIFLFTCRSCELSDTPVVVAVVQCYGHCLPAFKVMHLFYGLMF